MDFDFLKNHWVKYLIITIIIVIVIVAAILIIKYFKNKESFEKFEAKDLPVENWKDTSINDFVNSWKSTIRDVYKPKTESYVSSRQNYGSVERRYRQAEAVAKKANSENYKELRGTMNFNDLKNNGSIVEQYQESRTRKDFNSPLDGLSVKTGINYKY